MRDLDRNTSRRASLRYQIAGSLLLALALAATPAVRFAHLATGAGALANEGGGEGGGGSGGGDGGGGEGGSSGSGGDDGGDSGSGSDSSGESGESGSGEGGESGEGSEGGEDGDDAAGSGTGGRSGDGPRAVEHELVAIGPDENLAAAVAPLGISVVSVEPFASLGLSIARLRLPERMSLSEGRALLQAQVPGIELDVNALYAPMGSMTLPVPGFAKRMIGWPVEDGGCGAGLAIGMIDTGVDRSNPALAGRNITERSFLDAGEPAAPPEHGTTVAGILVGAGTETGLLPAAQLYVAGVFAADPDGEPRATAVGFVGALDWLVGSGVRAINVSLAGDDNRLMELAVARAADKGAVLVAAAGNGGPEAGPAYPAALGEVFAVTAVDADGRLYPEANRGDYVDFAAPGVRVQSPTADASATGTSFAAPYVTAIAASALAAGGVDTPAALLERLARSSRDLGTPGRDAEFGWGLAQDANGCGG